VLDNATLFALPQKAEIAYAYTKQHISIIGLGYVGAVTAGCLADLGHHVIGMDVDASKCARIANGQSPMQEKGLDALLTQGVAQDLIETTDEISDAIARTDVTFISVGTPTSPDGGCDLSFIEEVADSIGRCIAVKPSFHIIVLRSSVPPRTTLDVVAARVAAASGKTLGQDFGVAFVPEFLREGVAIEDFQKPSKTVIGASDAQTAEIVATLFYPVDSNPINTSIETAELVKYADNVWHATKVSFANEIGRLAKALGIDGSAVMDVFCQDTKLNLSPYYLKPGFAYGGSCLPKEVRAVAHLAAREGVSLPVVESLAKSNAAQVDAAIQMVRNTGARRVGILGVAFKRDTNDLRESPTLDLMAALRAEGIELVIHDACLTDDNIEESVAHALSGKSECADFARQIPQMRMQDIGNLIAEADAVFVTQDLPIYRQHLRDCDKPVIDAARLFWPSEAPAQYEGLGW
jgi:GDP-mannose 6-dehydrogenase